MTMKRKHYYFVLLGTLLMILMSFGVQGALCYFVGACLATSED